MRDDGQLIILTGFLMAIALAIVVILANNILISLNSPALMKPQERIRISDVVEIINSEVRNALNYFAEEGIDELNATIRLNAELANLSKFLEYTYAQHGIALDVEINTSTTEIHKVYVTNTTRGSVVYLTSHEFSKGSLIIPVDDNQWFLNDSDTQNDIMSARIFGIIYRILNDRDENLTSLDNVGIPVYRLIQDPRGYIRDPVNDPLVSSSHPRGIPYNISVNASKIVDGLTGSEITSPSVRILDLKGGPFLIDLRDINDTERSWIIEEAKRLGIDVFQLNEELSYEWVVFILGAPRLGVYPEDQQNIDIILGYFNQAGLTENEFALLNNTEIERGSLDSIDILFTPHTDISDAFDPGKNVTDTAAWKILSWVANGGVYHVECYGVETVDSTIEKADGNLHPWYGFVGVDPLSKTEKDSVKSSNVEILDTIFTNNATLFVIQTYTKDGTLPPRGGHTPGFRLVTSHNPLTVPLANSTAVKDAIVLAYAPFENGHLVYMGGHNQSVSDKTGAPTPERMMMVFNAIMLARAMKLVPVYEATVKGTVYYKDGGTEFTKEINITIRGNYTTAYENLPDQFTFTTSNLSLQFIQPLNGYTISGNYTVKVESNASYVELYLSNTLLGDMTYNSSSGYFEYLLNCSEFTPGGYILTAAGFKGSKSVYSSVSITIKNSNSTGSYPGTGANWEGDLKIEVEENGEIVEIKFQVWEDKNSDVPLSNADVSIVIRDKDGNVVYSGIAGRTNDDGKYEGEIKKENNNAEWNFKKGSVDYTSLSPESWEFSNNKKYEVEVKVSYGGKTQYFSKEFEYKKK